MIPHEAAHQGSETWTSPPEQIPSSRPPPSLPIPPRLDGVYRIERLLGSGAMGKVALAVDERLERQVAIKFIRPEHVTSPEARERFVQEARAMARVRDPHVVEIYALGETEGLPYLVMEYVPGRTLEALLAEHPGEPLPLGEALDVLDQVCRGVEAIHASGAVHRDLKPSNILLGPDGRVAVADLGLARSVAAGTERDEVAGTPAYMAPEVIQSQPVEASLVPRADVYALGVLAYRLFTGRVPFQASTAAALLAMHLHQEPPSLRSLRPDVPAWLEEVVLSALRKDPSGRVTSGEALRRALQQAPETFHGTRVLVVDDEASCARGMALALEAELPGVVVETASNGAQALEAIDARMPSLVVSDLDMPQLNGFELLATLRGSERTQHVPLLVMTATGSGRDWRLMRQLGAEGFLVKPLDLEQTMATVRAALQRSQSGQRGPTLRG